MNLIQSAIYTSSILNGNKKRPKRIKVSSNQFYPWAVERAAAQWLKKYFKGHFKQVANSLLLEAGLSLQFDEKENFDNENDLEPFANSLFTKVNENAIKTHHNYFVKLRIENMGVAGGEQLREDFVERFVENCRSTGEQEKNAIAQAIYNYKTQRGTPQKSLAEEIKEINENYSDKKAAFIARNEVSNLNASISEAQAQEGGFEMYEWLATGDEATRESHAALNGLICRYDDNSVYSDDNGKTWKKRTAAMYNGAPGFDYNCRCCAAPFDPEIFEETEIENEGEDGNLNWNPEKVTSSIRKAEAYAMSVTKNILTTKNEIQKIQEQTLKFKGMEKKSIEKLEKLKEEKNIAERRVEILKIAEKRHSERTIEDEKRIITLREENLRFKKDHILDEAGFKKLKNRLTIEERLQMVNQNFSSNKFEWTHNCQRCVPTFMVLLKGYDVKAKKLDTTKYGYYIGGLTIANNRIVDDFYSGGNRFVPAFEKQKIIHFTTFKEIEESLKSYGTGSVVEVFLTWNKKIAESHNFIAMNLKGKIIFLDPQSNRINVEYYEKDIVGKNSTYYCLNSFWRIDDKKIKADYIHDIMESR